jgi:hypothetical protein
LRSEALPHDAGARLIRAGLLTAVIDGVFSSVLAQFFYGSTVARLFQGVASVPLGADAMNGGTRAAAIGIGIHVCVAFAWSAIFLFVFMRLAWIRRTLEDPYGVFKIAALYGPFVWVTMSFVLVPLFPPHRFPQNWTRWWIQFIGHAAFVGLPIVASISGRFGSAKTARVSMA